MADIKKKIALVVHGRIFAFDLARELIRQHHELYLLTNYPKLITSRYHIPSDRVRSFLLHGILSKVCFFLNNFLETSFFEKELHIWFGQWALKQITKLNFEWDIICSFSGVAEETFRSLSKNKKRYLIRASSHICTQYNLLAEEQSRAKCQIAGPSSWIIQREQREYELADSIIVLSSFAYNSFIAEGNFTQKIKLLKLGTDTSKFQATPLALEARGHRILLKNKLRVLIVGTFSHRKGALEIVQIALATREFCHVKFVGAINKDARSLVNSARDVIEFIPKQSEFTLASQYAWGDVFIFPTIEDGYAVVLAQAQAAGLPILTTPNCSGPDIIKQSVSGWILPVRSPDSFVNQLLWCHTHRPELAAMVRNMGQCQYVRDWSDVASDFLTICNESRNNKT